MDDLITFLRDRLREDEDAARAVEALGHVVDMGGKQLDEVATSTRHGDPMRMSLEERFWSKVNILGPDDCWVWTKSLNTSGYGQFKVQAGKSPQKASRVAWWLTYGSHPGDLLVCHHCDNPPCCNPIHLFLGDARANARDMVRKGRGKTHANSDGFMRDMARRLTDEQIGEARVAVAGGESRRSVARRFGCDPATIIRLVNGTHWKGYGADTTRAVT